MPPNIADLAVRRTPTLDPAALRRVSVGYTCRREQVHCPERVIDANALNAVGVILADLQVAPEALVATEIIADGKRPALLLAPRGCTGRVVMIVREGLSFHELALALARLTPAEHDAEGAILPAVQPALPFGGDAA